MNKIKEKIENKKIGKIRNINVFFLNIIPIIVLLLTIIYMIYSNAKFENNISTWVFIWVFILLVFQIVYVYIFLVILTKEYVKFRKQKIYIKDIRKITIKNTRVLSKIETVLSIVTKDKVEYIIRIKGMINKYKFIKLLSVLSNVEVSYEN